MLFIAFLIFVTCGVLFLKMINTIKAGRQLPKFQNNLACAYLNSGRTFGFPLAAVFTYIGLACLSYKALDAEPYPALVPLAGFIFFAVTYWRAGKVLQSTKFVAVDANGNPVTAGGFLKPATVDEAAAAAVPQTA